MLIMAMGATSDVGMKIDILYREKMKIDSEYRFNQ
jgi:hypothetical protein